MKFQKTTLILFAVTLFAACGGKDKKEGDKKEPGPTINAVGGKLDGAWEIKRAEGAMDSANIGTVYEFKGDKLTFGQGSFQNPGNTVVTDSTFSFQAEGNDLKFMYKYKMNGDTLVVEMEGSGQTFYMVRK